MGKKNGFTLVELLISSALAALLIVSLFYSLGQVLRNWKKSAAEAERQQRSRIILERIVRETRAAQAIDPASSTQEVCLKINGSSLSYCLTNQKVRRKSGASVSYLSSEREIKQLTFYYPAPGALVISIEGYGCYVAKRN